VIEKRGNSLKPQNKKRIEKMKKTLMCALSVAVLAVFLCLPAYAGINEGTSAGTAVVGNAAPTVSSPGLWTVVPVDANNTNLSVDTEYWVNCTVGDNNQLYNIANVTYFIWEDNEADVNSADADATHMTFAYLNASDAFDEIGPDGGGDSHLIPANCSDPADHSATSGTYKLAWKLAKTANYTASISWKVNVTVYDGASETANVQTLIFGVNAYYELTVDDAAHGWTGLASPSTDTQITTPIDGNINVTVTANNNFKLQAKGSGDLANGTNLIGLGNVTINETSLPGTPLTTGYLDIDGLTNEARGASQSKTFILWIDVPAGTAVGTYTYVLSIQAASA